MPLQRKWAEIDATRLRSSLQSRVHSSLFLSLFLLIFLSGCHRTDFDADQTTVCPEPEGSLVVLDYTINCLYVADQPETGCTEPTPHDYFYADTFICSERNGASNAFLQALIDQFLDVDARLVDAAASDMSVPFSDLTSTVDDGVDDGSQPPMQADDDQTTDTDTVEQRNNDTCETANDGVCDEPERCAPATDTTDCQDTSGQTPPPSEP